MFNHQHHQRIHHILNALNPQPFINAGACFGGGTLIALLYNEYRWSKDIDFICPLGPGYSQLRQAVFDNSGKAGFLFKNTADIELPRDITANQYGIRFPVKTQGTVIKFEIVAEARITLGTPDHLSWTRIPCLNSTDRFAEKLLANADRWADESIESRDLIDLGMLRLHQANYQEAIQKAEQAYPVVAPLKRALEKFSGSEKYREKCFAALEIKTPEKVLEGLTLLQSDLN
ncbi:nucleotidyl transferase AbiEii/AbiGii toxin family protein [Saccharospirillum mangrovi]|uniref:nucleotidyl transferase AbiEii/AbiGii toxin family protein n=1 Tax=Saccharospirillum mangrovi TaxID=2161747 RepID=UPI0018E536DD|nr:nucleotidyl transferase AbiEii/AbiGii toxin family protein [Saccharospirillum mangrovi]